VNRIALLAVLALGRDGLAQPAPPPPDLWAAARDAQVELEACKQQAGSLMGDVVVYKTWKSSASNSLGANGRAIAQCVRDALKKHAKPEKPWPRPRPRPGATAAGWMTRAAPDHYTIRIGQPTQVLPPITTLMPVWRAAIAPHATKAERDAFAKLVPADYKISKQCIVTDRAYAQDLEESWLGGLTEITTWFPLVDKLVASPAMYRAERGIRMASWDGTGLVTLSRNGLCAETFDPATARAVFDHEGTCWAGSATDILLAPRIEFPKATYTQVSTERGRTCAVTTTGAVTCCGRTDATLGTPPTTPLRQIALGDDFACGLDATGMATCWGSVKTAPVAAFTKLVARHFRACGIHRDGSVECWPNVPAPTGTFLDIALDWGACGIHTDGTIECWDRRGAGDLDDDLANNPPGRWQGLAIGGAVCGLRRDQSVGCTNRKRIDDGMAMSTPVPQKWTQIAVSRRLGACGIQLDGTIGCSDLQPSVLQPPGTPPPTGVFTQIAAGGSQFCAVAAAGAISCWGDPWPSANRSPDPLPSTNFHGRIVDEKGAPIANATVSIEEKRFVPPTVSTSAADGTWSASTNQRTLWAKFTAPGREVVDLYGDPDAFSRPTMLRPASTITLEASCEGRPCPAMVELGHSDVSPPLEHVAPGTYRLRVWSGHGTEHERLATVEVEMPFAARPQLVRVALKDTGSGHAIHGSVSTTTKTSIEGLRVELRCANESYRRVETDSVGSFELRNVPPLPCTLEVHGTDVDSQRKIDSYADVNLSVR
jgi:hypothetical protein